MVLPSIFESRWYGDTDFSIIFLIPSLVSAQSWDFTPSDYQALVTSGGTLRFEKDSDWFPIPLQENLLTVLKHVLDPSLTPSSTAGVNVKDFYHGHWACEKSDTLKPLLFGESNIFQLQDPFFLKHG
ncbi:MAG: hypothetical protein KA715_13050 [Xanthomonadaceae bacterium]|nr:hypothetical protein [Xanthomonadaceae bacterium]